MKHNRFNTFEKQKIVSQNYPVKLSKIFGVMRKKKSIHEFFYYSRTIYQFSF